MMSDDHLRDVRRRLTGEDRLLVVVVRIVVDRAMIGHTLIAIGSIDGEIISNNLGRKGLVIQNLIGQSLVEKEVVGGVANEPMIKGIEVDGVRLLSVAIHFMVAQRVIILGSKRVP
jgi:hypothetical protein